MLEQEWDNKYIKLSNIYKTFLLEVDFTAASVVIGLADTMLDILYSTTRIGLQQKNVNSNAVSLPTSPIMPPHVFYSRTTAECTS